MIAESFVVLNLPVVFDGQELEFSNMSENSEFIALVWLP
jgi:hypothetical protein